MNSPLLAAALLCLLAACNRDATPGTAAAPTPATAPPATQPAQPAATSATPAPADEAGDRTRPRLDLPTVDGGRYQLSQHRGKWVVVNFWATWCGPCLKEMPELSDLHARGGNVEVVGLAYEETPLEEMRAFLKERPVSYPIALVDVTAPPADFDTPRALPTTHLIAPDGRLAHSFLGPVTGKDIEREIAAAGGTVPKS